MRRGFGLAAFALESLHTFGLPTQRLANDEERPRHPDATGGPITFQEWLTGSQYVRQACLRSYQGTKSAALPRRASRGLKIYI